MSPTAHIPERRYYKKLIHIADYVLFADLEGLPSEWYVIAGYGWLPVMSG